MRDLKNISAASRKKGNKGAEEKAASSDKAVTSSRPATSTSIDIPASVPELPLVLAPELPLLRKRLVGRPNNPGMVTKGKCKADQECRNVRRTKMSRTLEKTPELVLSLIFFPLSSEDALEPPLVDVPVPRALFNVEDNSDEFVDKGLV
ncbi:hypothetical protein ACOSP7_009886 [Xanthoceras sorbifolium]